MSLKSILLSTLLLLPMLSNAATVSVVPGGQNVSNTSEFPLTVVNNGSANKDVFTQAGQFTDKYQLVVDPNETASIFFDAQNFGPSDFQITAFNVSPAGVITNNGNSVSFSNLTSNTYLFDVSGNADGALNGYYTVSAQVLTSVPVPAALLLMSSALLGLPLFRRKSFSLA